MMPTFMIAGAARCGTTSLYQYLRQHPQIFMSPIKETNFFAYLAQRAELETGKAQFETPVTSLEEYQRLFSKAGHALARGEASPWYLRPPGTALEIAQHIPSVRLIFILRNPVERAWSSYLKNSMQGRETRRFEEAVRDEIESPDARPFSAANGYVRGGFYSLHLQQYLDLFERRQIRICLLDDLAASPRVFMRDIFEFVGVEPDRAVDTSVRFNTQGTLQLENRSHTRFLRLWLKKIRGRLPPWLYSRLYGGYSRSAGIVSDKPQLSSETGAFLHSLYEESIVALEALIRRDLSHWKMQ